MNGQLYYEDIAVGMEIPPLVKETSKRLSARWAGVCGDYDEYHYDDTIARENGFPAAIVNGKFLAASLTQLTTNWIGEYGTLKRFSCQHRRNHPAGETLVCKGKVTDKYLKDNEHLVQCEIWTENSRSEKGTVGSALVNLPSRM